MRRFAEHYRAAIGELRRLVVEEGAKRAEEYCHGLKGVAGNVGAVALFERLSELDAQLKKEQLPSAAELAEVQALLDAVLRDIDSLAVGAPTPVPAAAPIDAGRLREKLQRLAHALEYDLGAAEPVLLELRAGLAGNPLEAELTAIAGQVDVFDIDAALARVNELQKRLEPVS